MSRRARAHQIIRGPVFRSFIHPTRSLGRSRQDWIPHQGTKQRMRQLRHQCKALLESQDVDVVQTLGRVSHCVAQEPEPEYARLHLMCAGLRIVEDSTDVSWVQAMTCLLDKFEAMEQSA